MSDVETAVDGQAELPHLSISAHVVVQLGEELVTDMEQALLELAKNAYDADSASCEIIVEPEWQAGVSDPAAKLLNELDADVEEKSPPGRVRIRDKGTGISKADVANGWLKISASVKRAMHGHIKKTTDKGRTPVGDKGLGRLATMKIGSILRMKTAMEGEDRWRTVTFSWRDFTPDLMLEQVPVYTGEDTDEPVDHPGTIIEILGLHDKSKWRDPFFVERRLVPNLTALVSPFQTSDDFTITVNTGTAEHTLEHLDETVLNLAAAKFEFEWDGTKLIQQAFIAPSLFRGERSEEAGKAYQELFQPEVKAELIQWLAKDKKLMERGLSIEVGKPWMFRFEDELQGAPLPQDRHFPGAVNPGPFKGTLHYFLFHQDVKQKLVSAGVSAERLQAMSQVAIFRDGFRVRAERDWLRLHEAVTSGSSYYALRPSNVVGYFTVSNAENPQLVEKSDREGFVDTAAHRGFMTLGLRARDYANALLEATRVSVRNFQNKRNSGHADAPQTRKQLVASLDSTQSRANSALRKMQDELASARAVLLNASAMPQSPTQQDAMAMKDQLERASVALQDASKQLEQQSTVSRLIASIGDEDADFSLRLLDAAAVGLAARTLSHELNNYIRQLRSGLSLIAQENRKLRNPNLTAAVRQLGSVTREFAKTISTIDPLLPGSRALKENINVGNFLREFVDARSPAAERYGVSIHFKPLENARALEIRFSRTRLLQVVENLFQNSLYWLKHGPLPEKSRLEIIVEVTGHGFLWSDSGPGIRSSLESSVFDAYVSDKPKAESSGLGLHVVTTFLELERSSIRLTPKKNSLGRRYQFEVDLSGATLQRPAF
jgi:nitrogen-specific signal transduction histidine kinase